MAIASTASNPIKTCGKQAKNISPPTMVSPASKAPPKPPRSTTPAWTLSPLDNPSTGSNRTLPAANSFASSSPAAGWSSLGTIGAWRKRLSRARTKIFLSPFSQRDLPNHQILDWDSLRGRLRSSSFSPTEGHPNYAPMMEELRKLFDACQQDGQVRKDYFTRVYFGHVKANA